MSGTLAPEILDLIVDCVGYDNSEDRIGDLLSLSLACKALLASTQEHLFHDVTLYPPAKETHDSSWSPDPDDKKRYRGTVSFLNTIAQKPHLARYVRSLTCEFRCFADILDSNMTLCSDIPTAFQQMTRVRRLTVTGNGRSGRRFNFDEWSHPLKTWKLGISGLLHNTEVNELAVHGIENFQGQCILQALHLQRLTLLNTKVAIRSSTVSGGNQNLVPTSPKLRSFVCDFRSLTLSQGLFWMGLSPLDAVAEPCILVSQLQYLELTTNRTQSAPLLSQISGLRSLKLTVESAPGIGTENLCPFHDLNPASFNTLSHLELHIIVVILNPDFELDHPYGWAWKDVLSKLRNLECFKLHIEFTCYYGIHPSSFGPQWGDIPELLMSSTQLPRLKEVHILIHAVDRGERYRAAREGPFTFMDSVATYVYRPWFLPLQQRQERGELLAFSYETKIGSSSSDFGPFSF